MAGWISSKLKVAETFLQQIDQQAAESLGKNEKPRSDSDISNNLSPSRSGLVPLKDQLKKKTSDFNGNSQSDIDSDGLRRVKELETHAKTSTNPNLSVADSDWTELLGPPNPIATVDRSNGVSSLSVRKFSSPFPKKNQKSYGSVPKTARRFDVSSEHKANNIDFSVDSKQNDVGDSGGESNLSEYRASNGPLGRREKLSEQKGEMEIKESIGNGKQLASSREDGLKLRERQLLVVGTVDGISDAARQVGCDRDNNGSGNVEERNALGMRNSSASDGPSDSETDSASTSDSENESEKRIERRKRRERLVAEREAARAAEAIKERENVVARLEGEKQSLEKILDERAKQQAQEASELQMSMIETMEAADLEKQKHNSTRMEALARLAKLETTNAELAKSLANTQWNLEVEVNRVTELRRQIELKEVAHEDLRRRMSNLSQSVSSLSPSEDSKGVKFEREILEAEHSFTCDKIVQLQEKAKKLEENIEMTRKEIEHPTVVEVELKKRLAQLTDHLIQKQAQVEALSSEKATLLFRLETTSRLLDEHKPLQLAGLVDPAVMDDIELGAQVKSVSKLRPLFQDRIRSGGQHIGSFIRQLDVIFSAGVVFLRRNPAAQMWSMVYLICLHFWVIYILMSHSRASDGTGSGAVISLQNISNKTSGT